MRQFLLELGVGFAFVGSQVPLEVGGEDFRLDLLFYDLKLRYFVVIDLKMTPFKPESTGKVNFYRHPDHRPSIVLILCKTKNQIIAEYAVRDMAKPFGVAEFKHLQDLSLPTEGNAADYRKNRGGTCLPRITPNWSTITT